MDVRQRILRAAAQVFADGGFRGATTRRIAQEAGVNEITLFRHFGSKARLLMDAVAAENRRPTAGGLPAVPRRPRTEVLAWTRDQLRALRERRSLICTCLAEVDEHPEIIPPHGHTVTATLELRDYLRRLRRARLARAPFDPDIVAPMLMGVLFADAMGRDIIPDLYANDPDAAAVQYVDVVLRGIGVPSRAPARRRARTRE